MTEHLALTMFVRHYPLTFHVLLCPVPDLLLSNGLFSAAGLLELTASSEEQCKILLESQRQTTLRVLTGFGPAIINDQLPLPAKALAGCLTGMLPREWYKELNERTFFLAASLPCTRLLPAAPPAVLHIRVAVPLCCTTSVLPSMVATPPCTRTVNLSALILDLANRSEEHT